MNKSCQHSLFFYHQLAHKVRFDGRQLDMYVDTIDLADKPSNAEEFTMNEHQIRYYQQHAARGQAWANNFLGQAHLFGLRGMAQDVDMAAQHFEAAVAANDPVAAQYLCRMHWNGMG